MKQDATEWKHLAKSGTFISVTQYECVEQVTNGYKTFRYRTQHVLSLEFFLIQHKKPEFIRGCASRLTLKIANLQAHKVSRCSHTRGVEEHPIPPPGSTRC